MLNRLRKCNPLRRHISFSVSTLNVIIATVSIIVAAGATLGITLYFSIDSAHKLAQSSVRIMADKTRDQMISFVTQPVSAAVSTQYGALFGDRGTFSILPSEAGGWTDPYWFFPWERLQAQQMSEVDFKYQYVTIGWEDGYYVGCKLIPEEPHLFQCRSYSRANRTSTISRLVERNFSRATGALLGESRSLSTYDHRRREWYYQTSHEPGVRKWSDVYLTAMPTLPIVDLFVSVTNASGHFLAIAGWSYELNELDTELKHVAPAMGSSVVVVLLDNRRRILGSSLATDTYSKVSVERGYNLTEAEVNMGCVVSDEAAATLSIRICQHDIEGFGYAPLAALNRRHPSLLAPEKDLDPYAPPPANPQTNVVLDKLAGTSYYAAIIDLSTPRATNMNWLVIAFLPEESVTASIIKGRDVAIGVAVGLVVAITIIVGIVVKVLLSPLSLIAARMETAAYLRVRGGGAHRTNKGGGLSSSGDEHSKEGSNDNDDPNGNSPHNSSDDADAHERMRARAQAAEDALVKERKVSYLSDVAAIQNAYWDMADELWAVKGYIPEHVTRGVVAKMAARRAEQHNNNGSSGMGGGGSMSNHNNGGDRSDGVSIDGGRSNGGGGGGGSSGRRSLAKRIRSRSAQNSSAASISSREMTPAMNAKGNTNKNITVGAAGKGFGGSGGANGISGRSGSSKKSKNSGDNDNNNNNFNNGGVNPNLLSANFMRSGGPGGEKSGGISQADLEAIQQLSPAAVIAEHVGVPSARRRSAAAAADVALALHSNPNGPPIGTALPFFSPFEGSGAVDVAAGGGGGNGNGLPAVEAGPLSKGPLGATAAYPAASAGADCAFGANAEAAADSAGNVLAGAGGESGGAKGTAAATAAAGSNKPAAAAGGGVGLPPPAPSSAYMGGHHHYGHGHGSSLRTYSTLLTEHSDDHYGGGGGGGEGAGSPLGGLGGTRMHATMGSAENVSVAANRLAGLGRVEEDVPIFFGDNVLVDRDITIVHINIVNFHKYCRVTHGKDLKHEHETLVTLIYNVARRCGGVLDTFSGDKFFISFNAASKCLDHPVAALCFAHEVSSIVTKDAIWGARRRRIEQQCRVNNIPIPPDSKAFPQHVYKAAPFGLTCGVATGRAFVGPLGSERVLRHSVLSNAMTESVALERLCLKYPACRILIAGDLITMVDAFFSYQLLDAAVLPGTQGKRRRLASVKGPLRRADLTVFKGGCRQMAARARVRNIYTPMNDCFLAFLEGRAENCRQSLEAIDVVIDTESKRLQDIADAEREAAAAAAANGGGATTPANSTGPGVVLSSAGTSTPIAPTPNSSAPSDSDNGPDAPITDEECADMVIMSQFIWSLLQCEPSLDGRLYRSPLGETYQPIQHALYLVAPRSTHGPNGLPVPNVLKGAAANSSGDER